MHRLDLYINDIEPRIHAICDNCKSIQEEISLQESLSSYGWILLDSWIAWRTTRFLLRETEINDKVHEKWFKTPSSYTASQLRSIWKFSDSILAYIEDNLGKNFKHLIDKIIQPNRNASAHFSRNSTIKGSDWEDIKKYLNVLSDVFLVYEQKSFLEIIQGILLNRGYTEFSIEYSNKNVYAVNRFEESIYDFVKLKEYTVLCSKDDFKYEIIFNEDGCKARAQTNEEMIDVVSTEQTQYKFFGNKGYYRNTRLFANAVECCWQTTENIY